MSRGLLARVSWIALVVGLSALACALLFGWLSGREWEVTLLGERVRLAHPELLAALGILPIVFFAGRVSLADLSAGARAAVLCARVLVLGLIALALAQPERIHESSRVSAVALLDVSSSIGDEDLQKGRAFIAELERARGDHAFSALSFAGRPLALELPAPAAAKRPEAAELAHTDLAAALRHARGLLAPNALERIVVISDGRQTRGDALAEADRARANGTRIFYVPLERGSPEEVAVEALETPEVIEVGRSFELRARIFASRPTNARLRLLQDGLPNSLDSTRDVTLHAGVQTFSFDSLVRTKGPRTYRIELEPRQNDRFRENNTVSTTVIAQGRPTVLLCDREPARISTLADALHVADYEVEVRSPDALPRTRAELDAFDFVVLSDVPADSIAHETFGALEAYLREGGGLLVAGGEQSFGLGGYEGTPLERLLPVRMGSERRRQERSIALALVIDCSGSMSGQKIELAKEAARATAELLGPDDSLSVIGFSGQPERHVRMQSAGNRLRIAQDIAQLSAQGGTAIFPALDMALTDLLPVRARVKHVILLTDGQTQESGIPELVQAMRAESVTVSAIGLGADVHRGLLQQVAVLGGGRAYFTSDPESVPRIFVRETSSLSQSSVVEDLTKAVPVEPADFLKGIDLARAPLLRGYIATEPRPRPAQVILASELGEPLLARMRVGLGWSLAFTSDLKPRWSADFLRWNALPRFAGQLVREHMKSERSRELPMRVELLDDRARVTVDALTEDELFWNDLESSVTLRGPLGSGEETSERHPLALRAPGRYQAEVPLDRLGTFALEAEHRLRGASVAKSYASVARPYPREYSAHSADLALLEALAKTTGGGHARSARDLFTARGERLLSAEPLWPWCLMAALLAFLLDLLLRRTRLSARARSRL